MFQYLIPERKRSRDLAGAPPALHDAIVPNASCKYAFRPRFLLDYSHFIIYFLLCHVMQPNYGGYQPYNPRAPYPQSGQYYAPAAYPGAYPNGGGYADYPAEYHAWQNNPQLAPIAAQTPMARPQQLWEQQQMPQRQPSNVGGTPMPRPKTLTSKTKPPLKSAMKRPARSVSEPVGFVQRPRTNSDPHGTLKQLARKRTNSNTARDIPGMNTSIYLL